MAAVNGSRVLVVNQEPPMRKAICEALARAGLTCLEAARRGSHAITAAMELARRWAAEERPIGKAFNHGEDFFNYYRLRLRDLKKEVFISVLLDQKHRFLSDEVCSEGTLTASLVHPREVFRRAVREPAAAVAFVHNHPSGDPTPSGHDWEITAQLVRAAEVLEVPMLDHVIVGDSSYFSFFDEGMISSEKLESAGSGPRAAAGTGRKR